MGCALTMRIHSERHRLSGDRATPSSSVRATTRGQDTSGVVACPLIAPTEREQRWQLNQLRGLLLTLRSGDLSLEDCLRRLIRLLRTPMIDR